MEEADINRKPTEEDKIKALNEHSGKKKYEFWGKGYRAQEDWGKNLWEALLEDNSHSSSQYWGVLETWYQDEAQALIDDKEYRKERDEERKEQREDPYTDEEWAQYCYGDADFFYEDIDNGCCFDKEKDDEVAEYFGLTYQIIEWECDNCECCTLEDVVAVCECGYPLSSYDMGNILEDDKEDIPECGYCDVDLRTNEEKVLVNI